MGTLDFEQCKSEIEDMLDDISIHYLRGTTILEFPMTRSQERKLMTIYDKLSKLKTEILNEQE